VASDPEELLRSIERTREELAHTVDTIAGRLDPKRAAKRGVGALRDGVTTVVDGARVKLHLGPESTPRSELQVGPRALRVPKPAATGMAALVAFAAIVAVRRRRH
jgi:MYXO-CTERM domain-containing protein